MIYACIDGSRNLGKDSLVLLNQVCEFAYLDGYQKINHSLDGYSIRVSST